MLWCSYSNDDWIDWTLFLTCETCIWCSATSMHYFFPIHKVLATWHYCSMISFCANRFKILIVLYNLVSSYLQLVIVWTRFLIWTPFWHQLLLPVLFCQMTTSIAIEDVRREVKILKALAGNKNLVQFYDAYEDNENVYIVME